MSASENCNPPSKTIANAAYEARLYLRGPPYRPATMMLTKILNKITPTMYRSVMYRSVMQPSPPTKGWNSDQGLAGTPARERFAKRWIFSHKFPTTALLDLKNFIQHANLVFLADRICTFFVEPKRWSYFQTRSSVRHPLSRHRFASG